MTSIQIIGIAVAASSFIGGALAGRYILQYVVIGKLQKENDELANTIDVLRDREVKRTTAIATAIDALSAVAE
jgi:cell division protein FtsB